MLGTPTSFWAKFTHDEANNPVAWHPLEDHAADVAACFLALLECSVLRRRLATLGALDDLNPTQCARLAVLAALHDAGKYNAGFQNKAFPDRPAKAGHIREILALCGHPSGATRLAEALDARTLETWWDDPSALMPFLAATFAHHGKPYPIEASAYWPAIWRGAGREDPFAGMAGLLQLTRQWLPAAFEPGGNSLPDTPMFQHGYNGLLTLADWIGSDDDVFRFREDGGDRWPWAGQYERPAIKSKATATPLAGHIGETLPLKSAK